MLGGIKMAEDISKIIEEKIMNRDVDDTVEPPKAKKKNIFVRLALFPIELLKIFFGIDEDSINKVDLRNSSSARSRYPERNFREEYKYNPPSRDMSPSNINLVELANLKAYYDSIDGRGDPIDCDHDHDR